MRLSRQRWRKVFFVFAAFLLLFTPFVVLICMQGAVRHQVTHYQGGNVSFDEHGIPTISGNSTWQDVVQRQGYVHASERLWQMDLLRRNGRGQLAEILGAKFADIDRRHLTEDWISVAEEAYAKMPQTERVYCDAYALGVNDFIRAHKYRHGLEFLILGQKIEPWSCLDSLMVLMFMGEDLSSNARDEWDQSRWREKLSDDWQLFIYPTHHPWVSPLIGALSSATAAPLPPSWQYLPQRSIRGIEIGANARTEAKEALMPGSNAWVWTNGKKTFLAGDPHLSMRVPQVWYANRLFVADDDWAAGVSLAGYPGVVIGRNAHLAWSFTNIGEDVDDFLIEEISDDGEQYVAATAGGRQQWRRLVRKEATLKVRGQPDQKVLIRWTHRGPVLTFKKEGKDVHVSRQWSGLDAKNLRIVSVALNQAKDWGEFNSALNDMRFPGQSAVYADNKGRIGFRGTGVRPLRPKSAAPHLIQKAMDGQWEGYESAALRPRLLVDATKIKTNGNAAFLVNANSQLWVDKSQIGKWMPTDRQRRIEQLLIKLQDSTAKHHEDIQTDVYSEYYLLFRDWFQTLAAKHFIAQRPEMAKRWARWDGVANSDPETVTELMFFEENLRAVAIQVLRDHFFANAEDIPPYHTFQQRAWVLRLILDKRGLEVFGIDDKELIDVLLQKFKSKYGDKIDDSETYAQANGFAAQHPMVSGLPVIGKILFGITTFAQHGGGHTVRVERPNFGQSMRLVFDLTDKENSRWIFPVGQSGHIASAHYADFHRSWSTDAERAKVFPDGERFWR